MHRILIAFLLGSCLQAFAQSATVSPGKPTSRDHLTLRYTISPASALDGSEPIYARLTAYLTDGGVAKSHLLLTGDQHQREGIGKLPARAASVKIAFYTLNKEDTQAAQTLLVYDKTHQQPVRGAYLEAMFTDKPGVPFNQEIAAYPDNYLAYARYFNVVSLVSQPDTAEQIINQLLPRLATTRDRNAGLLAALCVGYAKTRRLAEGKTYLLDLFARFPAAAETAFAFSIYNYEYYKASGNDVEADVRHHLKQVFINHPNGALSRNENVFGYLKHEADIPLAAFERVMQPLYAEQNVAYYAFANLPELYLIRRQKLDEAQSLLRESIMQYQNGTINHQYRLSSGHYQMYVPYLLLIMARIDSVRQAWQPAIMHASAALALLTGSNTEGNFKPLLLPLRAAAYQRAGNLNLALDDYKLLYKTGQAAALDSVRRLFSRCQTRQKTIDELIASLVSGTTDKPTSKSPGLADFAGTDLTGKIVRLSDFKQKVVVINVWGIGCGPCVAEMPRLNALVKQFSTREDVVFLGITADKTPAIRKFLEKRPFDYQLLNNVHQLTELFNTNALPIHLVLNKEGDVVNRSIGARDNIDTYLSQLIQQQLE